MESANLTIVLIVLGGLAFTGGGILIWAYWGQGSRQVIFREIIPPPPNLAPDLLVTYQQGILAYRSQDYRASIRHFAQILKTRTELPEAYHNMGLAQANHRERDKAVRNLLKAAQTYLNQDDRASADLIKQQLNALKPDLDRHT